MIVDKYFWITRLPIVFLSQNRAGKYQLIFG